MESLRLVAMVCLYHEAVCVFLLGFTARIQWEKHDVLINKWFGTMHGGFMCFQDSWDEFKIMQHAMLPRRFDRW